MKPKLLSTLGPDAIPKAHPTYNSALGYLILRASFCCTKILKKLLLFLTKVAKSCIYSQTLKTTGVYLSYLFTYNAKYLQTLHEEKWRSFANSLRSVLKLRSTVRKAVSQLLHLKQH